ncbi:NAD(P)-binding protein [Ceratobasidium sp. AG-I]|nr:NAD(P)-binding protein [Ceratobasidium sp. AG-I]
MLPVTWLITGSSRGIGLELVTQLVQNPNHVVFATCRNPENAARLHELVSGEWEGERGKMHIVRLDVTREESIAEAAMKVGELLGQVGQIPGQAGLDYLIQNAAIGDGDDSLTLEASSFNEIMSANVLGPALIMKHLHPHLKKSFRPVVVNTSSGLASILRDLGARSASYSISKAALNMLTYKQAKTCLEMIVVAVHPGWVKTDMGTSEAPLEPSYVVREMIEFLQRITLGESGKFFRYDGELEI